MTTKTAKLINRLCEIGFTFEQARALRRCEMILHRWAEGECGDGNDHASWCIERDEETGKPFRVVYPHQGKTVRHAIPDREKGALKRAGDIVASLPGFKLYHQTDPRVCALYIMRESDTCYTQGVAVCA